MNALQFTHTAYCTEQPFRAVLLWLQCRCMCTTAQDIQMRNLQSRLPRPSLAVSPRLPSSHYPHRSHEWLHAAERRQRVKQALDKVKQALDKVKQALDKVKQSLDKVKQALDKVKQV